MINDQPLLTVIVPCYNVEKYIDKCISTIVGQTYTNLEILLINDGSTDETGKICDAWQEKDHRIRAIHKQNEGVSYARKTGVENATADYIAFVDSDDWIDKNMYQNMMAALLSTHSDIAQCRDCHVYEDGTHEHCSIEHKDGSFEIVDRIRSVLLLLENKPRSSSAMFTKVFKKHLFDNIEFPKGRQMFEDFAIAHLLFHRALQIVDFRDAYYFYLIRSGSACNSFHIKASNMKYSYDAYNSSYERYCFVEQHPEYHSCLKIAQNNAIRWGLRALRYSMIYPQYFPEGYYHSLQKQLHTISFNRKDILKKVFSLKERVELFVFLLSPVSYKWLVKLYTKIYSR